MNYYTSIQGVRYATDLLQMARALQAAHPEQRLTQAAVEQIYQLALDGRKITDTERRTLRYIAAEFPLVPAAKTWLLEKLTAGLAEEIAIAIQQVVRREFGFKKLQVEVDLAEVRGQEALNATKLFPGALRSALDAFINHGQGPLSLGGLMYRLHRQEEEGQFGDYLRQFLDQGTLYLLPLAREPRQALGFAEPTNLDPELFWAFGLIIPDLQPIGFVAYVHRQQNLYFSRGHFGATADLAALVEPIIRRFTGFPDLNWVIDPAELTAQMDLVPAQNFGNALFAALDEGIFNGESSSSFMDFIQKEVWIDPDLTLQHYQRQYINSGTLYLLPREPRAQANPAFPLPPDYPTWTLEDWAFGLEMPRKTEARFVITTRRAENEGFSSWNDGFILDPLPLTKRLQWIIEEEFHLEGLEYRIDEAMVQNQLVTFGPEWRLFPGVFRQALHTILHDYRTPHSVFAVVAAAHQEAVDPALFATTSDYRAEISYLIQGYLQAGILELLPHDQTDHHPEDGAKVEDYFFFTLQLPTLSDHLFWVMVPRWPGEEFSPYVFGRQ